MDFRGRISDKACLQAGQRGARSDRKRELISPNGLQKKRGEGVSLISTTLSSCSPIPSATLALDIPTLSLPHIHSKSHTSPALTLARGLSCESLA